MPIKIESNGISFIKRINIQNEEKAAEKICLIGNQSFAKTSIVSRYLYNEFPDKHDPIIRSSSTNKKDGLQIWDTAGLLKYRMFIPIYRFVKKFVRFVKLTEYQMKLYEVYNMFVNF